MRIKIYLFLLLFPPCWSQTREPIEADRPDQTETPAIVPKGMIQLEAGFNSQKNETNSYALSLPSALWKYGITNNMELRVITEFSIDKELNKKTSGLNPILVGCKIKLWEEKGILPKTSFIGHILIPNLASSQYKAIFYAPEFRFTMQHTLTEKLNLGYNLGVEWDGIYDKPTFIYTFTAGHQITNQLGLYAEIFGFAPQDQIAYHSLDGGFTYLINNNFMVDLSSSIGITKTAPKNYFAIGFSIRI